MMRLTIIALALVLAACDGAETDDGPGAEHCEPCAGEPLPECVDYCTPH
jgi:hypothetical protein